MTLDPQACQLARVVGDLESILSPLAAQKGLRLEWMLQTDLPECVWLDDLRLKQVLTNLVGNAIKFTERGYVSLQVSLGHQDKAGKNYIQFAVEDSGIGLTEEQQAGLFTAFHQADNSITRKHGGTGLGLVISQRLVTLMGGAPIEVDSELGQGSRFSFEIPLVECTSKQRNESRQVLVHAAAESLLQGRVLLVEDNPINQQVATEQLRQLGLEVVLAQNGQQAVEWSERELFDVILMDINMPVMDGYQATQAIRRLKPDLPIIGLSATVRREDHERALHVGMTDFLTKPIELTLLRQKLSQYVSLNKGLQ
jgi:CheY-like chemotaxis protein